MKHSVAIIGVGAVGSTIASALLSKNIVAEIILLDKDEERCAGEVKDLSDALGFSYASRVVHGTYNDVKKADIIIISAGRPQKPGESRIELIDTNKRILDDVLRNLQGVQKNAIVMLVANPLDILTFCTLQQLDLPHNQLFGTGTFLDSQRLKQLLSQQVGIAVESIEAYVLGEHGDSQIIAWSLARIAGSSVEQFGITDKKKKELLQQVRTAAYSIIQAKGATYYGIAACVATLCEMILFNARQIVPVSWYHEEFGACMSIPALLTDKGIERIMPLVLTPHEHAQLEQSAATLRKYQALVIK